MREFIEWCFRDETAGVVTFCMSALLISGIVRIIKAIKGDDE